MPFIQWSPTLSVKVAEMDNQHKQLINLLNELHDAMQSGKGKEAIVKTLNSVVDYTKVHFGAEEQYMQKIGYPGFESQKRAHKLFVDQIAEYSKKINAGENVPAIQMFNFLWNWLSTHIQKEDIKYGEHAAKHAGTPSAVR